MDASALAERVSERRAGRGDPRELVGELRRSVVRVPVMGIVPEHTAVDAHLPDSVIAEGARRPGQNQGEEQRRG